MYHKGRPQPVNDVDIIVTLHRNGAQSHAAVLRDEKDTRAANVSHMVRILGYPGVEV